MSILISFLFLIEKFVTVKNLGISVNVFSIFFIRLHTTYDKMPIYFKLITLAKLITHN